MRSRVRNQRVRAPRSRPGVPRNSGGAGPRGRAGAAPGTTWAAGLALVLAAASWLQGSALRLPFFADDYLFLDQARGRGLPALLSSPDPLRNFWRPVGRQLYFWVVSVAGESPVLAHALNLGLFLAILALLFVLVRRIGGTRAAVVAAAFVALHSCADVPVRWASGSQDLLAVALALGALLLAAADRRAWAAAALFAALLSKETAIVTPLVAVVLLRRRGEPWRNSFLRAWPMAAAAAAWAAAWLAVMRGRSGGTMSFSPAAIPAAFVHLLQAGLPFEWSGRFVPPGAEWLPVLGTLAVALGAIALAWRPREREPAPADPRAPRDSWREGLAWAALGALPVVLVAPIWSAYYYLFASCGLALALGSLLARTNLAAALAVVAALAFGSEAVRTAESFTMVPGNWGLQSHLDRWYFDRSMGWTTRYLEDLRRQRPSLPANSTVFFSGTRYFSGWQAADGPLVRWAYRDPTLRSYYFNEFTAEKGRRGPLFFFVESGDSLVEQPGRAYGLQRLALGEIVSDHARPAFDALGLAIEDRPADRELHYWRAWLALALGYRDTTARELLAAGFTPDPGPAADHAEILRRLGARDTVGATALLVPAMQHHALDPRLHALVAGIRLARSRVPGGTTIMEILAHRLLAPGDPEAWRRWAHAQFDTNRPAEARASLVRYIALAEKSGGVDAGERAFMASLGNGAPAEGEVREGLRQRPSPRR